MTMLEKFRELHPNAPTYKNGTPYACPNGLGWGKYGCMGDCATCWNREYEEAFDEAD